MSTYENQTGRLPQQSLLKQRYMILEQAGRGGMGAVYEAIDMQDTRRHVAIKEMSQGKLNDSERIEAQQRFQQEAAMLSRLAHPNLPRIYDSFSERGRSYLVMDFIEGKTLFQLLKGIEGQRLPVAQVLHIANQLCDVLHYLHQQHPPIIFRDLKPTNVMVTAQGQVYLIDFGIARIFKEGQQQDTVFLGSPGYAPPEQHGTSQTNPRSDLYSLGATLHCCLSGQDPYYAPDRFAFAPLRHYNPQVPPELDLLIAHLVSLDERKRPTSALEVQQMLKSIGQQAADYTTGLNPAMAASAPTQYALPGSPASTPPPQTAAVQPYVSPVGQALSPPQQAVVRHSSPWTRSFILLSGLVLLLTVGSSALVFNTFAGSDHLFETGLVGVAVLACMGALLFVRSVISRGILLCTALALIVPGLAFAAQAGVLPTTIVAGINLNQFLTLGLAGAALISLCWLARPFRLRDRGMLFVLFGVMAVCVLAQFFLRDELVLRQAIVDPNALIAAVNSEAVLKHLLLLAALITFIQGVLLAAQIEKGSLDFH